MMDRVKSTSPNFPEIKFASKGLWVIHNRIGW
jgi:hypothetical protein